MSPTAAIAARDDRFIAIDSVQNPVLQRESESRGAVWLRALFKHRMRG
jgi:hypothetical protein